MKPKDLKHPFSWKERRVVIDNGILFVPDYYANYNTFSFPGWEKIFGNQRPIHLEYCSGNGTWIAERAKRHPTVNFVACEMQFKRVRKIWSKVKNFQLDNLFIICGEALITTQYYIPEGSIAKAFVNYPDPWPKERHAKHRLIAPPFVKEVHRVLATGAEIELVTDDADYSEIMIEQFDSDAFTSLCPAPYYRTDVEGYGNSFFDQLWRSKGRTIRFHHFKKRV